jgi:hypothetical protein
MDGLHACISIRLRSTKKKFRDHRSAVAVGMSPRPQISAQILKSSTLQDHIVENHSFFRKNNIEIIQARQKKKEY